MSTTIDEKVVEMRFDNKQFENNVQTSLSTIEKLKQSLNLSGASKGLENVSSAVKNVNMSGLSGAVESVQMKFSALEVMAVTALSNITNSAMNAGKRIVSALTIDPISTGFQEYETQINAVQTILANTQHEGTNLQQVNRALDELNTYADKTIYNFTEMTRNIGTFTAAGVDLQTSVDSIKGIANLAAVSGSSSQQASTAMYQLSQALAAGKVQLMDWNSVVNAGMGGKVFQDALIRTSELLGTGAKAAIEAEGSFRESLTESGWLTTEVLTETLKQFAGAYTEADLIQQGYSESQAKEIMQMAKTAEGAATEVKTLTQLWDTLKESAQSGWTQTWETIVGDFEEAKVLFTEISDTLGNLINSSAEARNSVLQGWKDLGGRTALVNALRNAFEGVISIVTPVKEAFSEIFPAVTSKQLFDFTKGLEDLTEKFKIGEKTADNLKRTFKGVFALFDIGVQGIKALVGGFADLVGYVAPAGNGILEFTANIGDFIVEIDEAVKASDVFNKAVSKIGNFLKSAVDRIKSFVGTFGDVVREIASVDTSGIDKFSDKIQTRFEPLTKLGELMTKSFEMVGKAANKILPVLSKLGSILANLFGNLSDAILTAFDTANFDPILDMFNGGLFAMILLGVKKFIDSLTEIADGGSGIFGSIKDILDGVRESLEAWQTNVKAGTLLKIAGAMGILTAAIVALSLIDSEKLNSSLKAITVLFVELFGSMAIFEKIVNGSGFTGMSKITVAMLGLSASILILSGAVKNLSDLDWNGLLKGLTGVAGLASILVASSSAISKSSGKLISSATGLVIFGAAINVLVDAVKELGNLDISSLTKGLVGVGVLCTELALFLKATDLNKMGVLKGAGLVLLAESVNILADAVERFSGMDTNGVIQGLAAIGAILTELAIFTQLTGNARNVLTTATGMTVLGAAMLIFSNVVEKMGGLSWEEIGRGLTAMAGALAEVTIAMNLMPSNMITSSVGMLAVSAALVTLSEALSNMGGMSWEEIGRSLTALAGSMTIFAVALNAMKSALPGAAAVLVISAALAIFTPELKALGEMSWGEIAKGLVALAGAFAVIGVAGVALGPVTPAILGLAGAIAVLGVGCLAAGAGVAAFAAGLSALAVSGAAGAASLVAAVTSIISLIPMLFEQIGEGIVAMAGVITNGAPAITEAFTVLVLAAVEALTTAVPAVVDGVFVLLDSVLAALVEHTPVIVGQIFDILIGIIQALAVKVPQLVQAGVEFLMSFFTGIIDALSGIDVDVLLKGIVGIGLLSAVMAALGAVASLIPGAMVGVLGMGAVIAELALVLAAVGALAQIPGLNWLIGEGGKLLEGVGVAIGSFVGGIVGGFMGGVSSQFPQIGSDLSDFMNNVQPFIEGAGKIDASTLEGVRALAETILLLTAADILKGLTSWLTGGSSLTSFGQELANFGPYFKMYYESIKGIDGSVIESSANAAKTLAEFAKAVPNSGGLAGWIAGENSLTTFAQELANFGPVLKKYADSVKGLDPNVVANSANAALALAEMAEKLPNSGGVAGWFAGENNLSSFANELALFGPGLKKYADSISGLDANVVINSANAAMALSELASNLPNSGGLVSLFTGDNALGSFGTSLVSFGSSMNAYYTSISGINTAILSSVIAETKKLIELLSGISGVNVDGVDAFCQSLKKLGKTGIDGFVESFDNASSKVEQSVSKLLSYFTSSINEKQGEITLSAQQMGQSLATGLAGGFDNSIEIVRSKIQIFGVEIVGLLTTEFSSERFILAGQQMSIGFMTGFQTSSGQLLSVISLVMTNVLSNIRSRYAEFNTVGQESIARFKTGVTSKKPEVLSAITDILDQMLQTIRNSNPDFDYAGQELVIVFTSGIDAMHYNVFNSLAACVNNAINVIRNEYGNFKNAGRYLVEGFANGISENTYMAEARARAMASAAAAAARSALVIHSPSKVFYTIGDYAGEGFVNALTDYESESYFAGSGIAESAKKGLSGAMSTLMNVLDGDWDAEPVIRPVLDLSSVQNGANSLYKMMAAVGGYSISGTMNAANLAYQGMNERNDYAQEESVRSAIEGLNEKLGELSDRVSNNFENTFYVTGDDPKEIAKQVSVIIQQQVERRNAKWR